MLETSEQKRYLATILVLVVILSLISFWSKPELFKGQIQSQDKKASRDYNAYLASLQVDEQASRELFQEVISEEEVKREVIKALGADQEVRIPSISDSSIVIEKQNGSKEVEEYLKSASGLVTEWQKQAGLSSESLFDPEAASPVDQALTRSKELLKEYYGLPVPADAVEFHKAYLNNWEAYNDVLAASYSYQLEPQADPWPRVYKDYAIINDQAKVLEREYQSLDKKYGISKLFLAQGTVPAKGGQLVKTAQASLWGFEFVIDVKQVATEVLKETMATTFARFSVSFLDKLIDAIEKNYKIANFLYYTDALVSGQYVDDYLDKYVPDRLDRAIVKNFIPQLSCGNKQDLSPVFKAKADQFLGFDPQTLSPDDPQYYQKMSKVGNFLASENGWMLYYQDVASQAQAAARDAADKEMTSEGFKSSRDTMDKGNIVTAAATSLASIKSAFQAYLDFGNANAQSVAARITSVALQTFYNKFLFKGAVLKEQRVCIGAPQLKPVVPNSTTNIGNIPPTPSEFDVYNQYNPPATTNP